MKITRKLLALALIPILMLTAFAGCAKPAAPAEPAEAAATEAPAAEPATEAATEPATEAAAADTIDPASYDGLLAWYYPLPHPFGEACKAGIDQYVKDTGINVNVMIGPEFTMSSELENVEALAAQGYKHFGVFSVDAAATDGMYEELIAKGCTFVNLGWNSGEDTPASFLIATNIYNSAVIEMETLAKLMNYKGGIMVAYESVKDSAIQERRRAVEDVMAKYPDMSIVCETFDVETVQAASMKIEDALNANAGKINGIISLGFTCTQALVSSLGDYYGRGGEKIYCVGIDTDDLILQGLEQGTLDATVAQNAFGIGYISGEVLRLQADGYVPREGQYHIDSGIVMVTKDNMNNYSVDLEKVTKDILATLTTVYMEKAN
ncbi:MAG: sugar ABC transporter substrate-binding protein [Eubacteriales bacterium]|nr:sugar ABC transporter substrate-binding protein [Eubacteriales bacterium]